MYILTSHQRNVGQRVKLFSSDKKVRMYCFMDSSFV